MKKIGYLFCMFCMLFVSNACSDDDGGPASIPVTVTSFPSEAITAGDEVSILGTGFARNCEIYLKTGEELQKMNVDIATSGIKFKLPATQAAGVYPVILRQDGNDWPLGEITIKALVLQIDKITEREEGDDRVIEYLYTYHQDGSLASIETINDGDPDQRYDFKWTNDKLTVELYYADFSTGKYEDDYDQSFEYMLNTDKTVKSEAVLGEWAYTGGYLSKVSDYAYTYDGGKIDVYDDGVSKYNFSYGAQANKSVVDLMGVVLNHWMLETEEIYCARMAGVCGEAPIYLPSSVTILADPTDPESTNEILGSVTYSVNPETGNVNKITYDDGVYLEITYKTVK